MTEPKPKPESKTNEKPALQPIAVRSESGSIASRRFHTFADCSKIVRTDMEALEPVNEREIGLLGLKPCSACERRQSGGPTVETLTQVLADINIPELNTDTTAWTIIELLKERGVHLVHRKPKTD